jgi:16S rRNA C1402 (ribose-2'-O) methylase RsmI
MTIAKIQKEQDKAMITYETAKKIRQLLDEARKVYGATEWQDDDVEAKIIELMTEKG